MPTPRKYFDITAKCDGCGNTFTWTARAQRVHYSGVNTGHIAHGKVLCKPGCAGITVKGINAAIKAGRKDMPR